VKYVRAWFGLASTRMAVRLVGAPGPSTNEVHLALAGDSPSRPIGNCEPLGVVVNGVVSSATRTERRGDPGKAVLVGRVIRAAFEPLASQNTAVDILACGKKWPLTAKQVGVLRSLLAMYDRTAKEAAARKPADAQPAANTSSGDSHPGGAATVDLQPIAQ
jgi:hypothetical protein